MEVRKLAPGDPPHESDGGAAGIGGLSKLSETSTFPAVRLIAYRHLRVT
jgi:hypothetical protein